MTEGYNLPTLSVDAQPVESQPSNPLSGSFATRNVSSAGSMPLDHRGSVASNNSSMRVPKISSPAVAFLDPGFGSVRGGGASRPVSPGNVSSFSSRSGIVRPASQLSRRSSLSSRSSVRSRRSFGSRASESSSSSSSSESNSDDDEDGVSGLELGPDGKLTTSHAKPKSCWQHVAKRLLRVKDSATALQHNSLIFLSGTNTFRIVVYNIVTSKVFEVIIIGFILANCVTLAMDDPTSDVEPEWQTSAEYTFTAAFTIEMVLKVISLGFFRHPGAYLRSSWNVLDFVIVILSYLAFLPSFGNYTAIRTLRVLRPLRSMNALPGLQMVVIGLMKSVRGLVHVALLAAFIFGVFGILAVQLWAGKLVYRCFDPLTNTTDPERFCKKGFNGDQWFGRPCPEGWSCVHYGNPEFGFLNFDHIGWAFLAIFVVITVEGWTTMMYYTFDTWGRLSVFYFVLLVLIGTYFVLNLALAVISEEYSIAKEKEESKRAVKEEKEARQKELAEHLRSLKIDPDLLNHSAPSLMVSGTLTTSQFGDDLSSAHRSAIQSPDGTSTLTCGQRCRWLWYKARDLCYVFAEGDLSLRGQDVESPPTLFVKFIILCIIFNTVILAMEHHGQPESMDTFAFYANIVLTLIFLVEMLIKLMALGFKGYAADAFNLMDGTIVVVSLIELFLLLHAFINDLGNSSDLPSVSVFRALRLLRVFKLLKNFPSLRSLIEVMIEAVKGTGYLNIIILLYMFITSLVGMQFFGNKHRQVETPDNPIRPTYDSFYYSILTIFQIMTRDNWPSIMYISMKTTHPAAALFYIFLVCCGDFLILNLLLAILISAFDDNGDRTVTVEDNNYEDQARKLQQEAEQIKEAEMMARQGRSRLMILGQPLGMTEESDPANELESTAKRHSLIGLRSPLNRSEGGPSFPKSPTQVFTASDLEMFDASRKGEHGGPQDRESCDACGEPYPDVLPTPSLAIKPIPPKILHARFCGKVQLRKAKERTVVELIAFMDDHPYPTPRKVEELFGRAWEVGLLLNERYEEYTGSRSWDDIREVLHRESLLLKMKIGEELIGRSLVGYTRANIPKRVVTNGSYSFFIFSPDNKLRLLCTEIVSHPAFDKVILGFIMLSSIAMAVDNPRNTDKGLENALFYLDIIFTSVFALEMTLKLIAFGLVMHPGAYLRDSWNILDGLIVIIAVVSLVLTDLNIGFLKVFRTFRALRPLRVINRNRGIKMVVTTLFVSVKGIANVALVTLFIFLVFGILGVQLLAGKLYKCTDPSVVFRVECIGYEGLPQNSTIADITESATNGMPLVPRRWIPFEQNFDNLATSLLTLFEVATLEGWTDIMYNAIDAVSHDRIPVRNNSPLIGLYFVVFVIIGAFFMLNLFVGYIIFNFNVVKSDMDGLSFLSPEQKLWIETQRLMMNFRPTPRPMEGNSRIERLCFQVAQTPSFEFFIAGVIMANVAFLATDHNNPTPEYVLAFFIGDIIFSAIFLVEMVIKLVAFRSGYFISGWNRFDCLLVILSIVGIIFEVLGDGLPINVGIIRVFRVFRIMRILRLVRQAKQVRILLETLWYSFPQLANIGGFLLLLFFIYAVLGVQLFAEVKEGDFMGYHANFKTFGNALLLLIRMSTGEDWNGIMHDTMIQEPDCVGAECGTPVAPLYFTSFLILSTFVMTNLFVAIILDNFNTTMQLDRSDLKVQDMHTFVEVWEQLDQHATMRIPTKRFPYLLSHLKPPLGISRTYNRLEVLKQTRRYMIPEHGGQVHFIEALVPLARSAFSVELSEEDLREHEEGWKVHFPDLNDLPILRYRQKRVTLDQYFSSSYIAGAYRRKIAARLVNKMRRNVADEIDEWYDKNGVPPEERHASMKYRRKINANLLSTPPPSAPKPGRRRTSFLQKRKIVTPSAAMNDTWGDIPMADKVEDDGVDVLDLDDAENLSAVPPVMRWGTS